MTLLLGKDLVQIPLDYYKILGVTIHTDEMGIEQAYRDRLLQMPRREYSEVAVNQRKILLDKAYAVLSDSSKKAEYDQEFFAPSPEPSLLLQEISEAEIVEGAIEENNLTTQRVLPYVEISEDELVGAVVILLELGEYESAIQIGQEYLNKEEKPEFKQDVILTLVLAELEIGREQWQQKEYELAAITLNQGRDMLLRYHLLSSLNEEIKADLQKLRPYRILELLAQGEDKIPERLKGLQLLKQMLQERSGIDGKGDDQSGLGVDDFLRFVQQLQTYLTVVEQQEIFEVEADRPSAVAAYLAFYALLARGFSLKKPELIVRATEMLKRLKKRQDMSLEQAVCSLLLGKTQEAILALENTKEQETLDFIKENSQGSPDLLPGLCLYAERWLQTEVFSHFRDLSKHKASLDEYFAEPGVQKYLDELAQPAKVLETKPKITRNNTKVSKKTSQEILGSPESLLNSSDEDKLFDILNKENSQETEDRVIVAETIRESDKTKSTRRRRNFNRTENVVQTYGESFEPENPETEIRETKKLPKLSTPVLVVLLLSFFGLMGVITSFAMQRLFEGKIKPQEKLSLELSKPPVPIPSSKPKLAKLVEKPLDVQQAKHLVEQWLSVKAKAFGSNHDLALLKTVLAEPFLSQATLQAQQLKTSNAYRQYQHNVELPSVKINPKNPNQASIQATVTENSKFYRAGVLNPSESYNSKFKVRYELVRNNQQWLIKEVKVLP